MHTAPDLLVAGHGAREMQESREGCYRCRQDLVYGLAMGGGLNQTCARQAAINA